MKRSIQLAVATGLFLLISLANRASAAEGEPEFLVVVDPGHGGTADVGSAKEGIQTLSRYNNTWTASALKLPENKRPAETWEKFQTLELSKLIVAYINKHGAEGGKTVGAFLTRKEDVNLDMAMRAKIAADGKAASFVSIHFNAHKKGATPIAEGPVAIVKGIKKVGNLPT